MKLTLTLPSILLVFGIVQAQKPKSDTTTLQSLEIISTRATSHAPFTRTEVNKKDIEKNNTGRDLPFLINQTPSIQANSDAGNGIGYTGFRIRGTDATRINITINGIPYNDAESQGTFLVNLPDLASSSGSIQIQRGVGSSTNGTGAFGGSIHINTNENDSSRSLVLNQSYGSFNSSKTTLILNSGLMNKHVIVNGRLSSISSDGYVDRSKSRLRSFYTSAVYLSKKQSLRLNIFSGKEKTNAAWFGINQVTLDSNRTYNPAGTEKAGSPYENETDNYTQTHYQLFYNRKINSNLQINLTGFAVTGKGYFEQYKTLQAVNEYNLSSQDTTDLIRQLWLDNIFYGTVFSAQFTKGKHQWITGGTFNDYNGKHYGILLKTIPENSLYNHYKWYDVPANKKEYAVYSKWEFALKKHWHTYIDLQLRKVNYHINGFEKNPRLIVNNKFLFFNPKAGISYDNKGTRLFFSFARAAKEPNRDDFETGQNEKPRPEKLNDFELGFKRKKQNANWGLTLYYMAYKDQLVLTGKVNEVFAYTRTNIPQSYRAGLEGEGSIKISKCFSIAGNLTLSTNKVKNYIEYYFDYDNMTETSHHYEKTDISFSPSITGALTVEIIPFKHSAVSLLSKYVGRQFLDNTSNENRMLDAYFVQDLKWNYDIERKNKRKIGFFVQLNNLFSAKYVANGYTFSYVSGGNLTTENYFYPMATFNLMTGVNIKL